MVGNTLHFTFDLPQGEPGPTRGFLQRPQQRHRRHQQQLQQREHLGMGADGGYNQSQMQDLINKVDELINALRR